MKRRLSILLFFLLFGMLARPASAFYCGSRLVHIGDTKFEVIGKCGSPDWQESWVEERFRNYRIQPFVQGGKGGKVTVGPSNVSVLVPVIIEEWTYNLGPSQFVRILTFENNELVFIRTTEYGY